MRRFSQILLFSVIIGLSMGMGWAGTVQGSEKRQTVTYRLKWLFNVSVAGDLYATAEHLFQRNGLDVTIKEGGPERDAIKELELGYADFGVASADQVIRARTKRAPVVVLAQLFQSNPLQWIYHPDRLKIERIADLRGRVVCVTFGGNDEAILRTLLANGGLGERDVTLFSVRYDYTPFYRKQVDIWPVYRNAQGVILADKLNNEGETVAFLDPAKFGVIFVANSVVASERTTRTRPDLVRRFLRGLMQGWMNAMKPTNHDAVIDLLQRYDPDTPPRILEAQLAMTRRMVRPTPEFAIGTLDVDGWRQTEAIMLKQRLIASPVSIEQALRPDFLPE